LVGREDFLGARPSAVFDLTRLLRPGPNVIAIEVVRSSKPLAAQARAILEWREGAGVHRQVTDASWRAQSHRELAAAGTVDWSSPGFDDSAWPFARVADAPGARDLPQPDSLPVDLLQNPSRAHWIWHDDPQSGVGTFVRDLPLDVASVQAGWLGVSVEGVYTVAVNGFVFESTVGADTRMDVLDIAPFLRRGHNQVALQVSGGRLPLRLAVAGRVVSGQGVVDFSSDGRWHQAPSGEKVRVLGSLQDPPPALAALRMQPVQSWQRTQFARWLGFSALTGAALLWLGFAVTRRQARGLRPQAWMRHAQPWAAAALVLGLALLADLDPRVEMGPYYPFWVPAGALLCAALVAAALARRSAVSEERA
jgi:hypothetical protein